MFHCIIHSKEVWPDELFPVMMMMVVVKPISEVNDVNQGAFNDQSTDDISKHDLVLLGEIHLDKSEDEQQ